MDFRAFALVFALLSFVAGDAHAQLAPGDSCILKKSIKVSAKPKGKGKKQTLEPGIEVMLEQVRGKWMKLVVKGATLWLKRGKLKGKCGGAEVVDDPVFESGGLGGGEIGTTTVETATETTGLEPTETITAEPLATEEDDDLLIEAEPEEPVDETDAPASSNYGGDFDLGALAGLGVGGQGGKTRLTFDLVIDGSYRLFDSIAVGGRLFLHGTPGVGYGFGGLTLELRYFLPPLGSIEPYAQAGIGGGYGAAGTLTPVFAARLGGGGRMFIMDRLFASAEIVVIISQLSAAGSLDVGVGWSF